MLRILFSNDDGPDVLLRIRFSCEQIENENFGIWNYHRSRWQQYAMCEERHIQELQCKVSHISYNQHFICSMKRSFIFIFFLV